MTKITVKDTNDQPVEIDPELILVEPVIPVTGETEWGTKFFVRQQDREIVIPEENLPLQVKEFVVATKRATQEQRSASLWF